MNPQILVFCLALVSWLIPIATQAQVETFQDLPFLQGGDTIGSYANALYRISIAIAALLVVIRLIMAGVKYMFSEVVTNKQEAKNDIREAILGLLIILAAVTLLQTINPDLVNLEVLNRANTVVVPERPPEIPYDTAGNVVTCEDINILSHRGGRCPTSCVLIDRVGVDSCATPGNIIDPNNNSPCDSVRPFTLDSDHRCPANCSLEQVFGAGSVWFQCTDA